MRISAGFLAATTWLVLAGPVFAWSKRDEADCLGKMWTAGLRVHAHDQRSSAKAATARRLARVARLLLYRKGDYGRAMDDFNKAIQLDPNPSDAYQGRAIVYEQQADYDRAIADLDQAIQIDPSSAKSARTYANRALTYRDKGDYDHAITDYNKATQLDAKLAVAYYGRARNLRPDGRLRPGRRRLRRGHQAQAERRRRFWRPRLRLLFWKRRL